MSTDDEENHINLHTFIEFVKVIGAWPIEMKQLKVPHVDS